ncbi:MAG: WD40 repeat domain-containing protein [Pirellulales bacterium]
MSLVPVRRLIFAVASVAAFAPHLRVDAAEDGAFQRLFETRGEQPLLGEAGDFAFRVFYPWSTVASRNGAVVAAVSSSDDAIIFETTRGSRIGQVSLHDGFLDTALAFDDTGAHLAVVEELEAKIVATATGQVKAVLQAEGDETWEGAAFSHRGSVVAVAGSRSIAVFDYRADSPQIRRSPVSLAGEGRLRVAFSEDDSTLTVATEEGRVLVFDLQCSGVVHDERVHESAGIWSHNENFSLAADGSVVAYSAQTGVWVHRPGHPEPWKKFEEFADCNLVSLSADGTQLVASGGPHRTVKLLDVSAGVLRRTWSSRYDVTSVTWSSTSKICYTASNQGRVRAWDVELGRESELTTGLETTSLLAASGSGQCLWMGDRTMLYAIDGRHGRPLWRKANVAAFAADGEQVRLVSPPSDVEALASDGHVSQTTIRLPTTLPDEVGFFESIFEIVMVGDEASRSLAYLTSRGRLGLWNLRSGDTQLTRLSFPRWAVEHRHSLSGADDRPLLMYWKTTNDSWARIYKNEWLIVDARRGAVQRVVDPSVAGSLIIAPDGRSFAAAWSPNEDARTVDVTVWEATTGREIARANFQGWGTGDSLISRFGLAFGEAPSTLWIAGNDGSAHLVDIRGGRELVRTPAQPMPLSAVVRCGESPRIAVGTPDGVVAVYERSSDMCSPPRSSTAVNKDCGSE